MDMFMMDGHICPMDIVTFLIELHLQTHITELSVFMSVVLMSYSAVLQLVVAVALFIIAITVKTAHSHAN